jgi:hypothetical protein
MRYGDVRGAAASKISKSPKKKKKKKNKKKSVMYKPAAAPDPDEGYGATEDAWEEHPIPAPPPVTKPAGPLRGSGKPKLRPWIRGGGVLNIANLPWHMRSPPKGESASRRKKREALLNRDMKYFEKLEEPL